MEKSFEQKAPESLSHEDVIKKYLSYQDAPVGENFSAETKKEILTGTLSDERAQVYAHSLEKLLREDEQGVEESAERLVKECIGFLDTLGIAPTPYGESKTWAFWDMAKQQHYLDLPDSEKKDAGYRIESPFTSAKQEEILNRHIGWEAYNAYRYGADFMDDIFGNASEISQITALLEKDPKENGTLNSKDLATLGLLLRNTLTENGTH